MSFNPLTDILAAGGINFKGAWNADANTPILTSGMGTAGDYYIVGEAGTTVLDGIGVWDVNEWAVFNGTVWQKVSSEDQSHLSFPEPIVFRPGGPSLDEPGVYGTWLAVMAFVGTLNSPVEVVFDSSLAPCVVPTGVHTFPSGSRFRGRHEGINTTVSFDDGASLVGVNTFERGLSLVSNSTSPILSVSGAASNRFRFQRDVTITCLNTGPFIRVSGAGSSARVVLAEAAMVSGVATILDVATNAVATLDCLVSATIGQNTLGVDGSSALTLNLVANTILNPTQTGILGLYTVLLSQRATQVLFDPSVLSGQLAADNTQDAIDELTLKHNNKLAQTISSPGTVNISALSARLILVDMTSAGSTPLDINLPAISADSGPWMFKRLDSNTASSVKIYGTGGNTIDLLPFQVLSGWPASMHLVSGPSNWYRI